MRKLIPVLILISLFLTTSCMTGRPPEYSVSNPYAISDSSDGVVVAYKVNNGQEMYTYVQRLDLEGDALWNKQGIDLGRRSGGFGGEQGDFSSLVRDRLSNVTVLYYLDSNIWAKKLDMGGNPVWEGETTKKVSPADLPAPAYFRVTSNNAEETIIAWAADKNHISIQKSDGNPNYFISISAPDVEKFDISSDDSGNVFILWKDNPSYSEGDIFIQKVNNSGQASWPTEGLQLTNARNPGLVRSNLDHMVIGDGEGGVIAVWVQGTLSEDGKLIIGQDLYAQHINNDGKALWGENGKLITSMVHEPRIIRDPSGNIVLLWTDLQNVYAQRLDADGNTSWSESGINIGQAGERNNVIYYYAVSDGAGGTVVVWNHAESGNKYLYAQRLDADAKKLWGDNGVKVSEVTPYWGGYATPARVSPDGNGGFFVTWAAGKYLKDKTSSYIQRISSDGEILWGENGVKLGT